MCGYRSSFLALIWILVFSNFASAETTLDKFLRVLGGQIPYPPDKIVTTLEAQGYTSLIGKVVIPNGRSLERRFTDYQQPRSMVSFALYKPSEIDRTRKPEDFIYIAYTPRLNQLEIIAGKAELPYDFLIVKDYKEGNPHAMPAPPSQGVGLCLACHQNGGPIFPEAVTAHSQDSWFETDDAHEIGSRLVAQASDPFSPWLRVHFYWEGRTVISFDNSVRDGVLDNSNVPSSRLKNRFSVDHEAEIDPGVFHDPLIPRPTDQGKDAFSNPSPKWTISLTRDGTQSYPSSSPSALFVKYCASCHAGANSVAPTLPLNDLHSLGTYEGVANRHLKDLLAQKIMPPIGSDLPSPEDRKRMLDALN